MNKESTKNSYRQYTITNNEDILNLLNGRCPDYALNWRELNSLHWPQGHDYYLGNKNNINDKMELREILSDRLMNKTLTKKILFCDLDGVLVDFNAGVKKRLKKYPIELNQQIMWSVINKSMTFFELLPWMPKGKELWNAIREYDPIILTGVPYGNKTAAEQKRRWCARHLGPNVKIICCYSKDKPKYCLNDSILIDDRPNIANEWNEKGGEFILYSEDNLDDILERIKNSNIM
jgi:hypothetical protein